MPDKDRPRFSPRTWGIAVTILTVAIVSDQITKALASRTLSDGRQIDLVGTLLSLRLVHNSGAAFSVGAGRTWIFTIIAIAVLIGLVFLVRTLRTPSALFATFLFAGGSIGNLIDRLIQPPAPGVGHVIDFINYGGLFVGNVADIWIVVAAAWLVIAMALEHREEEATNE